jgi:hypothetical protein
LFLKDFLVSAKHLPESSRDKEAPQYWSQMADSEKLKWRKRLQELKEKYINKYENFLKVRLIFCLFWSILIFGLQSLTQEQLKEYSVLKAKNNARREQAEAEKSGNEDDEDDDGDDSSDVS